MRTFYTIFILTITLSSSNLNATEDPILFFEHSVNRNFFITEHLAETVDNDQQKTNMYRRMTKDIFFYWYQSRYLKGFKSVKTDHVVRELYHRIKEKTTGVNETVKDLMANDPASLAGLSSHVLSSGETRVYLYSEKPNVKYLLDEKTYKLLLPKFKTFLDRVNSDK